MEPNKEYSVKLPQAAGGLNLRELPYLVKPGESPEMQNLLMRDGALNCRQGQVRASLPAGGRGINMAEQLFHGYFIIHAGTRLYSLSRDAVTEARAAGGPLPSPAPLFEGVPEVKGSFFSYGDCLYYKTRGAYIRIMADEGSLSAESVEGYVPVILVNADPETCGGDRYQPENRLSPYKTIWYTAREDVSRYRLPEAAVSVKEVTAGGVILAAGTDYSFERPYVVFTEAPEAGSGEDNTVHITCSMPDPEGYNAVMDCTLAAVCGGTGGLCAVFGGCGAQPDAFFWNGHGTAMDPSYFPYEQYQQAGDAGDPVTAFGRQQSSLVIFREHSVGRSCPGIQEVNGRNAVDMPYVPVNSGTGCLYSGTVRLIGNNLVWCTDTGVWRLRDMNAAREMRLEKISAKIEGGGTLPGLTAGLRGCAPRDVCSLDDGERYHVAAGGRVWSWDYSRSPASAPAWFYLTNINALAFCRDGSDVWHLDAGGALTHFERVFSDYGEGIEKIYAFPVMSFGSFDRLKDVTSVIISTRSDTDSDTVLTYADDYGRRDDRLNLKSRTWNLYPRNLRSRSLRGRGFAEVFRRRPGCRRVKHFAMRLYNRNPGEDLSVVSAQVFYRFCGRLR